MGIFRTPKYKPDPELEKKLKEEREEAERQKEELEAKDKKFKERFAKGIIGQRSLFSRASGQGFYTDGEQT